MSRYTKEQLSAMAKICLEDREQGGFKYMQLTLKIALQTGLSVDEIDRRIEQMAASC